MLQLLLLHREAQGFAARAHQVHAGGKAVGQGQHGGADGIGGEGQDQPAHGIEHGDGDAMVA